MEGKAEYPGQFVRDTRFRDKPLLDKCVEGHDFEGHKIRLVGFHDSEGKPIPYTLTYAGWVDRDRGGDQWLVKNDEGEDMLRCGVAEMIPFLMH